MYSTGTSEDLNEGSDNVRFRRWIAMTPDGLWREFRGTPNMQNIGEGRDLTELVDQMMVARINHFDQMSTGWRMMRSGLTAQNSSWIYSEMMTSMDSLQQFELRNFLRSHGWTHPLPRNYFPGYLSDVPVRDGQTTAVTSRMSDNLTVMFGDFVPIGLRYLQYPPLMQLQLPSPSSSSFPPQPVQNQTTRQCSGIGFTFNATGRGETTVTTMSSFPCVWSPESAVNYERSLQPDHIAMWNGNWTSRYSGRRRKRNRNLERVENQRTRHDTTYSASETLSLLTDSGVSEDPNQSCESSSPPLSTPELQVTTSEVEVLEISEPVEVEGVEEEEEKAESEDGGENQAAMENEADTVAEIEAENNIDVDSNAQSDAEDTEDDSPVETEVQEINEEAQLPDIATITVEIKNDTEPVAEPIVEVQSDNIPEPVPTYAEIARKSQPKFDSPPVVTENGGDVLENKEIDVICTTGENESEWTLVKNKRAIEARYVQDKIPIHQAEPISVGEQLEMPTDKVEEEIVVETDDANERRLEKRRAQRKNRRARKLENNRQAELLSVETTEEATPELPAAEEIAGQVETVVSEPPKPTIEVQPEQPLPIFNSSGIQKLVDNDIIREEVEANNDDGEETSKKMVEATEMTFTNAKEHAKMVFRLLWFDNKKKVEQLHCDAATKLRLQSLLDMVRIMKDRVDMAGRIIVYRVGRPQISNHVEESIVKVARNLIDVTRHTVDDDMVMAQTVCELVGRITKNLTYMHYVFSILTLPEDFFPKLADNDVRLIGYKEIIILTKLHMKRVEKIYEQISDLYEFRIEKVVRLYRRRNR